MQSWYPGCSHLFHDLFVRRLAREEVERRQGQREGVASIPLDGPHEKHDSPERRPIKVREKAE